MRKILLFAGIMGIVSNIYSQPAVGINTEQIGEGIILQVESNNKGILLPKINLSSLSSHDPLQSVPIHSTLIFNETNDGNGLKPNFYYWNSVDSQWSSLGTYVVSQNLLFKGSNQLTNVNFNSGSNYMDIFANILINEDTNLYRKIDNTSLFIAETGFYRLCLNLDMRIAGTQDRDLFGIAFYLNNVLQKDQLVIKTNEYGPGTTQTLGYSNVIFLFVPAGGATLRVQGSAIHGISDVYFKSPATSTISLERVR